MDECSDDVIGVWMLPLQPSIFHSTHSVLLCLVSLARRFSAALEKVLDHLLTVGFSITIPLTLLSNASLRSRLHIPQPLFKISSLTAAAQKMALPSMPLPLPSYKGHSEIYRTHKLASCSTSLSLIWSPSTLDSPEQDKEISPHKPPDMLPSEPFSETRLAS